MMTSTINQRLSTMTIGTTAVIGSCTVTRVMENGFIVRHTDASGLARRTLGQDQALDAIESLND